MVHARVKGRRDGAEGGLTSSPPPGYVWVALILLVVLEATTEIFGVGGPSAIYTLWVHDIVLAVAALLVLARAVYEPTTRPAWLAFGLAMVSWCLGEVLWGIVYGGSPTPPYPSFADVFWLMWYPLTALGIFLLIRIHFPRFELHRWLDGLAVIFLVLAAGIALVVQPLTEHARHGALATVVNFAYPVLDIMLIGAILGVYGLLGWRPGRMWVFIGLSTLTYTIADAIFGIQEARGTGNATHYDFLWTLGALCLAYAAWVAPTTSHTLPEVTGLRAVALPLLAQAFAAGIQIYAFFFEINRIERVVTVAVLIVASVQIILTRPRAASEPAADRDHPSLSRQDATNEDEERPGRDQLVHEPPATRPRQLDTGATDGSTGVTLPRRGSA